jgi:beta-lysine 5,6-aminomutase beta subunit
MLIQPYGDTLGDGATQLSFTLPVRHSARAVEAARQLVLKMGFHDCQIVHSAPLSAEFSFFVAYGKTAAAVDPEKVHVEEVAEENMTFDEVTTFIREHLGRKIIAVVVHRQMPHTRWHDAVFNMKGYNHHNGLVRYPMVEPTTWAPQSHQRTSSPGPVQLNADAILVSQVVTQKERTFT